MSNAARLNSTQEPTLYAFGSFFKAIPHNLGMRYRLNLAKLSTVYFRICKISNQSL